MNKRIGLAAVAAACGWMLIGCVSTQTSTDQRADRIRRAVLETDAAMTRAAESLNADNFFEFIADSPDVSIIQDGRLQSRAEALAAIRRRFSGVKQVRYDLTDKKVVVLSPDAALLTSSGTTSAVFEDGSTVTIPIAETVIFVLKDGRWKALHGHQSVPNPN